VKSAMVGLGTGWVLVLMLVLSIISLAVMLERAWLYWSLRDDIDELMRDLGKLLRGGDLEGARRRLEASRSAEAAVVVAGLVEADRGVEAAQEAMEGASALQRLKLEKRLAFLGTLGACSTGKQLGNAGAGATENAGGQGTTWVTTRTRLSWTPAEVASMSATYALRSQRLPPVFRRKSGIASPISRWCASDM